METSIFLAKAFGIYLIIICLSMIGNKKYYHDATASVTKDPGEMFITSIMTLIAGIFLILFHNIWVFDWRVIITLLAWITFIKGIYRILFPHHIQRINKIIENNSFYYSMFTIFLIIGIFLFFKGFEIFSL